MSQPKYVCDLCNKPFVQKNDYTRHRNGKKSCVSVEKLKERVENEVKNEMSVNNSIKKLQTVFDACLDILRDSEHLTGDKALRTLARLLILRLIEPKFGKEIDIDGYDYRFEEKYDDDVIEEIRKHRLSNVRFSAFSYLKEDDIMSTMKKVWVDILSVHPSTKQIFPPNDNFGISRQKTFTKLFTKLNEISFEEFDVDTLGCAYEHVVKNIMVGKTLGQFFTQPIMKDFLVELLDPKVDDNGRCETIRDLAMGTGGLLLTCLRHLIRNASKKGVSLDWNFICSEGVTGREAEPDTYKLAVSNMLISTGHVFKTNGEKDDDRGCVEYGDSIRNIISEKYDVCIANPPFGIKGLNYDDITDSLRNEAMPICTNSAVSLFLQMFIYNLKIGGRGGIILPDGQDLFGKSGVLVTIREYLMKTCELKEVVYFPSGVFSNTTIKTCVFYFVKRRLGTDALTISDSRTKRSYKFSPTHVTKTVKFYDYNPYEKVKNLLAEVDIDTIASNSYSLNYAEYVKVEEDVKEDEKSVVKTLEEVCTFKNGKGIKKEDLVEGEYPVIGGGQKPLGFHNEYNCNENTILCSSSGAYAGFISRYNSKTWISDCFSTKSSDPSLSDDYLYYFLKMRQNEIYKFQNGVAQPHVYSKDLSKILIPIPPLSRQKEIVEYFDFLDKVNTTSRVKIDELKKMNEYKIKHLHWDKSVIPKSLGDICDINPETMKKDEKYSTIQYIDISSVKSGSILNIQELKNEDEFPSRAKRVIMKNDILYSTVRPNLKGYVFIDHDIKNGIASTGFAHIRIKNSVNPKYVYYCLTQDSVSDYLVSIAKGAQYPAVSGDDFVSIQIPVPPLSRQKEIVDYCEKNDKMISTLQQEIEENKEMASQFLKNVLSNNEDVKDVKDVKEEDVEDVEEEVEDVKDSLQKKSVSELKEMAKSKGMKGFSKMKKEALIELLSK